MKNMTVTAAGGTKSFGRSNMLLFALARLITDLGSAVYKFALSLYVLDITGSAGAFSMILGFSYLPGILINILAGVFVDRHNKKKIIVICEFFSCAAVFAFLTLFKFNFRSILFFTGYAIVLSTVQAFILLALNASIPNLVDEENVPGLNSIFQGIGAVIEVVGPLMGAIAYTALGIEKILIVDGATFAIAGVMELFLRFNRSVGNTENKSYFEGIKDVFNYLKDQKAIKYIIVVLVASNALMTPLIFLALTYITYSAIKVSEHQVSFIQAAFSFGIILGAVLSNMKGLKQALPKKIFILFQLQGVMIAFWYMGKLPLFNTALMITALYCLLLFTTGVFNGLAKIPMFTYVQLKTPEKLRASVFGVAITASTVAVPVGFWIFGILLENFNWAYVAVAGGISMLAIGLLAHVNKDLKEFFVTEASLNKGEDLNATLSQ